MQAKPLALPAAILLGAWLTACGGGRPDSNGFFAANDTALTRPSAPVSIDILANDSAGAVLDSFQENSANGVILREDNDTPDDFSDDKLQYNPGGSFEGVDRFNYTITDPSGNSARTATVTVTVSSAGQAIDDAFTVDKDSSDNNIPVIDNDSAGMEVTAVDTTDTETGASVTIAEGGGSILYTPPTGFTGEDYFSYTAERTVDGKLESDTADVTITVDPPAQPTMACGNDVAARLAAGQGYCYAAKLVRTIQGKDGPETHTIDFTVFVPHPDKLRANAEATGATLLPEEPGFAPLLIHSHGFGGEKYTDFSDPETYLDSHIAKLAWEAGYFVLTYTQRGFAGSGSQIGLMRPDLEGFDFVDLVNWAVVHLREHFNFDDPFTPGTDSVFNFDTDSHINPNAIPEGSWGRSLIMTDSHTRLTSTDGRSAQGNPALATIGYSWGGIFQFVAQSVDTRLDAIMPMGTGFDLRYTLASNDTPKTAWITIMTSFAINGGNGEELPDVLTDGNSESNGANLSPDDRPHNKQRQLSIKNYRKFGPSGTIAYCDGNKDTPSEDPGFKAFTDGDELTDTEQTPPPNATTDRKARAHLFMIQGYGDTLFNFNEGYDNARCFAELAPAGTDVRLLEQTSGHPLPGLGPNQYAGAQRSMYMDEVVHCGLEGGIPRRYVMRDVGLAWLDFHLRDILPAGAADADDIFPRACIVQENTDTDLQYKTGDDHPEYSGTNDFDSDSPGLPNPNSYRFPREGVTFDTLNEIPRGCSGDVSGCEINFSTDADNFESGAGFPGKVTTGPSPDPNGTLRPAQFLPLYTVTNSQVMAGIPLINMTVTRDNPLQEEIFFVGVGIRRANSSPELLHFQVAPIRIFPSPEAVADAMALPPESADFPLNEPRNNNADNSPHYPIRFGANPGFSDSTDTAKGRLPGVSARLLPGDQVGLMFFAEHPVYKSISSPAAGTVSVVGSIELPLLDPSTAPDNIPAYVENTSAP